MKTVEELEALLEAVTRERDLSLFAWESAGMQGRDAQSAMLELARQLEEARAEVAALTTALDERDLEAERGLEQYDKLASEVKTWQSAYDRANDHAWEQHSKIDRLHEQVRTLNGNIETFQKETWRYKHERDEARAEVERLRRELERAGSRECDAPACNCGAWHHREHPRVVFCRGAEAMREACIAWARAPENDWEHLAHELENMPIPEEP